MIQVGNIGWTARVESTLVLKDVASALVPVKSTASSVVWHFIMGKDGGRLSYEELASQEKVSIGADDALTDRQRHFVGLWTTKARVVLTAQDDIPNAVGRGASEPAIGFPVALKSITFGVQNIVTVEGEFERGRKDTSLRFEPQRHTYDLILHHMPELPILMYDTADRRAWLLDGLNGLAYLMRAWMKQRCHADVIHRYDKMAGQALDIFAALKSDDLRMIVMIDKTGRELRQENEKDRFLLRDLAKYFYMRLERIHDTLKYRPRKPAQLGRLQKHSTIQAFDVLDVSSISTTIELRTAKLKASSGPWPTVIGQSVFIPLLAARLGSVIQPVAISGSCGRTQLVPSGLDLMAATIDCLRVCNQRWNAQSCEYCFKISELRSWIEREEVKEHCSCNSRSQQSCIPSISNMGTCSHQGTGKMKPVAVIMERFKQGAVIFGAPNTGGSLSFRGFITKAA